MEILRRGGRYEHCDILLDADSHLIVADGTGCEFIARRAYGAWAEVGLQDCIQALKVRDEALRDALGLSAR